MGGSSEETPLFHWHFTVLSSTDSNFYNRGLFLLLAFFSLIILIAILFLYTHWICGYRRSLASTTNATSTLPRTAPEGSSSPPGLDPATIDSLPIILMTPRYNAAGGVVESECSICLSIFDNEEKVKVLPICNHVYHPECVDKWLITRSSCPLCRASLSIDTVREKGSL